MRAIHVGRAQVEYIDPPEPCLIISITDPGSPEARIPQHSMIRGFYRVEPFHDVDRDITEMFINKRQREIENAKAAFVGKPLPYILFDRARADKIVEFLRMDLWQKMDDMNPTLIVTHCEAGISRSSAVTAAIQEHYGLAPTAWRTGIPNAHVYRVMTEAFHAA